MPQVRQFFLEFDKEARAVATLLTDLAPATTSALWEAIREPITVTAMHAMYAGPEIMVDLPESARTFDPEALPPENQQVIPTPGDLMWYYQRPFQMAGLPDEMWEVGVFYAGGARVFGPLGWTPVNIFARITEGLDAFAKAANQTRFKGVRPLTIGRVQ